MKKRIIYFAPDTSMGDVPSTQRIRYRIWALCELSRAFPGHHWRIANSFYWAQCWTDDDERREEIVAFCANLWGRFPWDGPTPTEGVPV